MIQEIETLGPELHALRLGNGEVFEKGKVDVSDAGSADNVAAFVAELAGLRGGVQLLERSSAYPLVAVCGWPELGSDIRLGRLE